MPAPRRNSLLEISPASLLLPFLSGNFFSSIQSLRIYSFQITFLIYLLYFIIVVKGKVIVKTLGQFIKNSPVIYQPESESVRSMLGITILLEYALI